MHPLSAVQRLPSLNSKIIQKLHNSLMTIKFYVKAKTKLLVGKYIQNNIDPSESGEFLQLVQYSL